MEGNVSSQIRERPNDSWKGVVLAGGRSSRMGVDKCTLIFKGKTLLERTIGLLAGVAGEGNVLISGSVPGDPRAVPDVEKGLGPIGGLQAILRSGRVGEGDWIILAPVDMPGLNEQVVKRLKLAVEEDCIPNLSGVQFESWELPVVFRNSADVRKAVAELSRPERSARERSLRGLWSQLGFRSINLAIELEPGFKNLNTQEDWDGFLKGANESKTG